MSSIFNNISDSVVQIVSIIPPLFNLNPQTQNTTEVGAGFIYDKLGHVVTANHILAGGNSVSVIFKDGDTYNATVVGRGGFTDNGEVMIRLDTGEKIELHKHNVKFENATKEIVVDSGTETYWIGAERVSYYWIHTKRVLRKSNQTCSHSSSHFELNFLLQQPS